MSALLRADAASGQTGTYFYLWNSAGLVYNGAAMVTYSETDKTTYQIAASEIGTSGRYVADFPAGLPAGLYDYKLFDVDGNGISNNSLDWDGTQEVAGGDDEGASIPFSQESVAAELAIVQAAIANFLANPAPDWSVGQVKFSQGDYLKTLCDQRDALIKQLRSFPCESIDTVQNAVGVFGNDATEFLGESE